MNYSDALDSAKAGFYITRIIRYDFENNTGPFLSWNAQRGYLEIHGPSHRAGEEGKPAPWNPQPGDAEATDWMLLGRGKDSVREQPSGGTDWRPTPPPSYAQCIYCRTMIQNPAPEIINDLIPCLHCHHEIMLAALAGAADSATPYEHLVGTAVKIADAILAEREKRHA